MTKNNKAKSVAQELKGQLDTAKKTKVKETKSNKLVLEFQNKKEDKLYSFILFQKGNEYRNFSVVMEDGVETPLYDDDIKTIEKILGLLDDSDYELVKYNSKWDIIESKDFDEGSLRFFVKKVKEQIIKKIEEK